jgi:hypothetical protein
MARVEAVVGEEEREREGDWRGPARVGFGQRARRDGGRKTGRSGGGWVGWRGRFMGTQIKKGKGRLARNFPSEENNGSSSLAVCLFSGSGRGIKADACAPQQQVASLLRMTAREKAVIARLSLSSPPENR